MKMWLFAACFGYILKRSSLCVVDIDAVPVDLYLFPPPYTLGSTHMSSSGVESIISWNSDHSSLLPIPEEDFQQN